MNEVFDRYPLGNLEDLEEGGARGFLTNDDGNDVFFVVKSDGQLFGWRNACPHINGAPMAWRKDAYMNSAKSYVCCHAHGALFEPKTGLCIQGPCLGQRLKKIVICVDAEGNASVSRTDLEKNKN
ncbi:Rieske (2Fe-2S) protein [Neptunomonas phycophila]|uniref:Rieske (2Fe-2S) protein n=1 Tax=Neptunomonas phycophila TaxID=1572645 RepID=UPI0009488BE3|nr:Rieske (2Fe-2S) protein [Neptunomonas phycophila]